MKWANNIWLLVSFFTGILICYLTLQFSYFEVKKELDIPNIILSVITLLIGLFIAITLQKKVNRSQNQHSYLIGKLDTQWISFNAFSQKIIYDNTIDVSSIRSLINDVIRPSAFLKNIFISFCVNSTCVINLENKLDELESTISNISAINNVVNISSERVIIENKILEINKCFSDVMKKIQYI